MCGRRLQNQIDAVFGGMGTYVSGPQGAAVTLTREQKLERVVGEIRELHKRELSDGDRSGYEYWFCGGCGAPYKWPCKTIKLLDKLT